MGRKTALMFLNTIAGGLLGLVAIKALGYYVSPAFWGQAMAAYGYLGLLYFITDLGFQQAHVKRVSEGLNEDDCVATLAVFKAVSTTVFALVALSLIWWQFIYRGVGFEDVALSAYLLFLLYYALLAFRTVFQSTFDARREAARAQAVLFFDTSVRVVATVFVAIVFAAVVKRFGPLEGMVDGASALGRFVGHYPAGALAATFVVGAAVSLAIAVAQWKSSGGRFGRFRWEIFRGYWTFALPLFLVSVVSSLSTMMDRVALSYFGTAVDVGIFDLPKRFSTLIEAIPMAVAALLFPAISELNAANRVDEIKLQTRQSLRYLNMLVLPPVAFVVIFSPQLILLFIGAPYLRAALAMSILVSYSYVIGIMRPYFSLLTGMGRSDLSARAGVAMGVSNGVLNVLLIPTDIQSLGIRLAGLNITGAALATLLSGLIGFAILWVATRNLVGEVHVPGFFKHAGAVVLMAGALILLDLHPLLALERWYHLPIYGVVGAGVYFLALWFMRELTREDVALFLQVANAREMARYVRGELRGSSR